MGDLVHHPIQSGEWFAILLLIATVGGIGLAIVAIVLDHIRASREQDGATALKMEMIQQGMSAGDIERVLAAKSSGLEQAASAGYTEATAHAIPHSVRNG